LKTIVLASQSPRRKKLLSLLYQDFICHPADIDENLPYDGNPDAYCRNLALLKAKEVATEYNDSLVIGSDTIVVFKNKSLGKPENAKDAERILGLLSGNTHSVFTGVALIYGSMEISFSVETEVVFHDLSEIEIKAYVATGSPMDKAGAYGIQDDWGAVFVKKIIGDYYNVVGFPIQAYYKMVQDHFPSFSPEPQNQLH